MKVPARCNRRNCQKRRNLSKRPEFYRTWPTCGCGGKMYVDEYRLRRGVKDHPERCYLDCYPYPHAVDSPNCREQPDFLIDKSLAPLSKHCPIPSVEPSDPIPF